MAALWKPVSESDGNLVIVFDEDPGNVVIKDKNGKVIATGRNAGDIGDGRIAIRFDKPGSAYKDVLIEIGDGQSFYIDDGASRRHNITFSPAGTTPNAPTGQVARPEEGAGGGAEGERVPGVPGVAPPIFIDPSIVQPFPISPSFIPQANFQFTDPLEFTGRTAEFNREQSAQAFETGLARAKRIQQEELASIIQFAQGISEYQQQLVGQENAFNQQQRLQAAETAIPGVQDIFARQRERAETLAEGKLLSTAEDRALELTAQSASAEGNFVRGFGDDSVVGRTTSEKLSAQQRLGLTQLGENFLSRSLQQAAGVLMDVPLKASISQRLPSQPNVPLASVASTQQQIETGLTTIAPATALNAEINQQQFATNLEQRTNEFNANMQFSSDQFNSGAFYNALLQQLGLTLFNAQQQQNFIQGALNAQAQGEQLQEARDRYDQLLSDYQKNRDKNQLLAGISTIFGSLGYLPEFVWDSLGNLGGGLVNLVAESLGLEPPFPPEAETGGTAGTQGAASGQGGGSSTTGENIDTSPATETPPREPESAQTEETAPQPFPEDTEETVDTGAETPEDASRMLVFNPRTGNFRYRFFTEDMLERLSFDPATRNYRSGADIHLTRRQLRELRGLV